MVISMYGTASRVAGQGLHVGRFFQVMSIVVAQEDLVAFADAVVEASRSQILPRVEWKHSSVILKLVNEEALHQLVLLGKKTSKRVDRQEVLEQLGARGRRDGSRRRAIWRTYTGHRGAEPEVIQRLNDLLLCRPRVARWKLVRERVSSDGGRGEDRAVGQQGNGILGILPQAFERSKQEGLVFRDGEAQRAAILLAAERVLDRFADRIGVEIRIGRVRRQGRTKGERIARVHGAVAEKAKSAGM